MAIVAMRSRPMLHALFGQAPSRSQPSSSSASARSRRNLTAAPHEIALRTPRSLTSPIANERSPHMSARAAPPHRQKLTSRHVRGFELSVLRGVPLARNIRCHARERARLRHTPPRAKRARAHAIPPCSGGARVRAGLPHVCGIAAAAPVHALGRPGHEIVGRQRTILGRMPRPRELRQPPSQRVRDRHLLAPAIRTGVPVRARFGALPPDVVGSPLADPPHESRRAWGHVSRRERPVQLRVPLARDSRRNGRQRVALHQSTRRAHRATELPRSHAFGDALLPHVVATLPTLPPHEVR